ncbi:MAG TPA: sigma-70 family RNA polymerase sigma factor [Solirubrobacterales bacterium]|nr:sigma-70 family RNA polymerase sigma factor [Solirubrobacterales bacterium]
MSRPAPDNPQPHAAESWEARCARLFEEMRRPARAMVARAYGRALGDEEIDDVYSAAWAATLAALRERGRRMDEGELRAYILTAVASHASKELRRRSRKPLHPLEVEREQSTSDGHMPLPDEIAIGSEARSVARDLLTSLPERRRAVMLLRYGWGLSPREVCALIPGLSPRAYRKEVTRGVEDLIEGLGRVDSGEWCEQRRTLVRDLVAGTADEEGRRQALEHLGHCRACADLAARLRHDLHDAAGVLGLASVAGCIGGGAGLLGSLEALGAAVKSALAGAAERIESAGTLATGAVKGSGPGVLANVAGVGGATKTAVACIGAGAAATACVAAGVVPGVSIEDDGRASRSPEARTTLQRERVDRPRTAMASVLELSGAVREQRHEADPEPSPPEPPPPPEPEPDPEPVQPVEPVTPAPVEEFDPVAATAPADATTPPPAASGGGSGASSVAQEEFGP